MNKQSKKLACYLLAAISITLTATLKGQSNSPFIVIDQFGYLPQSKKIAVIRDPQTGFDATASFSPGSQYVLVNKISQAHTFTGTAMSWKSGTTDPSSGDKVWWFDFSSVSESGTYYVMDVDKNLKSYDFEISPAIYTGVLRHAMRYFFYQRAGFAKTSKYAGAGWTDGASHLGPLQDKNARPYNNKNSGAGETDLSGGWYDAGDYNRYTNWTANYVVDFMRTYMESPDVWDDHSNIPESENGIPDILDEAKWGIDHLLKLQKPDGSVLSILSVSHASPPSSAEGQSLYGTASTSATLNSAAAFAIASKVYGEIGMTEYAGRLKEAALKAWEWAAANPAVIFKNNDEAFGTAGIGAGQQETDDYGRFMARMEAATFLFEITGNSVYKEFVEQNYMAVHLMAWNYVDLFEASNNEVLLYYARLPGVSSSISTQINTTYKDGLNSNNNYLAHSNSTDPYMAYISYYGWGTNSIKSLQGLIFTDAVVYAIDPARNTEALDNAEKYIHYIHGVNPLNLVYLSNMYAFGGDNCVNEFYHSWFSDGSPVWDRVGVSAFGPPPGFLTGGANPGYQTDSCCPGVCGGTANNAVCVSENLSPPQGQPDQKSYKDFNTSWPLNSWEVTENSNSYQLNYIRLLSKFIQKGYDCNGTAGGSASFDACNICSGGTSGHTPSAENSDCEVLVVTGIQGENLNVDIYPNPTRGMISVRSNISELYQIEVFSAAGKRIFSSAATGATTIDLRDQPAGLFLIQIALATQKHIIKIIKL